MASRRNFAQISSIPEIIIRIYKFLNFEDKLRLSRVDTQLRIIFKSFVWRKDYRSLNVYKNPPYFVVTSEKCENRLCLNSTEYQEFLRSYADEVLELTLYNPDNEVEPNDHDVYLNYFQNLVSFKYDQITIPLADVKLIAVRYTNLQELKLKSHSYLYVTDKLIEYIRLEMLNLRRLCIETSRKFNIKLSKFQEILNKPKLETLKLTAAILWEKSLKDSRNATTRTSSLNMFSLLTSFNPKKWPSNCESYFENLKSLTALTITIDVNVTDQILATIAKTCKSLKVWRFERTVFSDIKCFPLPLSVEEFSLFHCSGTTYENLKHILNQYSITKFNSSHTTYKGEFEDFPISLLIETLHIAYAFDTLKHESAYKAINNIRELVWFQSSSMLYITPSFSLKHCINLHTLVLINCQIDLAALLELKSLRKLVMPHPVPLLEWTFITQLIQEHSSLRELLIKKYEYYGREYRNMDLPLPHKQVLTQVHSIEIPFDIMLLGLDFWMDLFSRNNNLKLIICDYQPLERLGEAIRDIVNHRYFPKSMKTINMCGFRTECNFIRNHYDEYVKELEIQTKNSWHENDMYRITLYRK